MTLFTKPKIGSWNLTDLIEDPNKSQFQEFLQYLEESVKQLELKRNDLSPKISATDFENLLHLIEDISEKVNIASGYASLRYSADTSSNEAASLVTKMEIMRSNITNRLLFFDLWFKKDIDAQNAQRLINSIPSVYQEYLKHKRLLAKYTLTESEEKIIKKIFPNKEKMLSLIRSPKLEEREAAYKSLLHVYKKNSGVLGEIYQNLVIQWYDEHISMRGFQSPISARNISNNLDDTTVETLLSVCKRNSVVFQDYFKEKAKMLGIKKLQRYHLYAPLSLKNSEQKKFNYENAVNIVLQTFQDFDPQFRKYTERIFKEQHIDSEIRKSKLGGAFCYTVSPKRTPYVLLNYNGKSRDVSTMAHEFGHAIHSIAASDKPIMVSHAPLPLAETASVFAEMLLNDNLTKKVTR